MFTEINENTRLTLYNEVTTFFIELEIHEISWIPTYLQL